MDKKSQFVEIEGMKIHYILAGQGDKTVVLLHGGGLDTAELSWGLIIPELMDQYRVIALDWPGFGESDKPDIQYGIPFFINVFEKFLVALQISSVYLIGISMGGAISIGYTLQNPKVVEKLVLVDSYGFQRKLSFHALSYLYVHTPGVRRLTYWLLKQRAFVKYSMKSILKRPGAITETLVDQIHQQVMVPGVAKAFSDLQDHDVAWNGLKTVYLDQLPRIQARTLIIHGSKDTLVPLECSKEAQQLIPNSQLIIMEGCGHWPQRDHPEEFNRIAKEFLANQENR